MELKTVSLLVISRAGERKVVSTGKMHLLSVQVLLVFSACVPAPCSVDADHYYGL